MHQDRLVASLIGAKRTNFLRRTYLSCALRQTQVLRRRRAARGRWRSRFDRDAAVDAFLSPARRKVEPKCKVVLVARSFVIDNLVGG